MAGKKGKKKPAAAKKSGTTTPQEAESKAPSEAGDDAREAVGETPAQTVTSDAVADAQGDGVSDKRQDSDDIAADTNGDAVTSAGDISEEKSNDASADELRSIPGNQPDTTFTASNGAISTDVRPDEALRQALEAQTERSEKLQQEKVAAEAQYRNLLSKVSQMKATLGARIKEDAEELAQNKVQIDELMQQNAALSETVADLTERVEALTMEHESRGKTTLTLTEAVDSERKRREQAEEALAAAHKAYESAKERQSMQISDWETIALEERAARDQLRERIAELEEQASMSNAGYASLRSVAEQDANAIQAYKKTIHEMQVQHQTELRESVDSMQATVDGLNDEKQVLVKLTEQLQAQSGTLQEEIAKLRPHESEVKEKTLLIGKLRHEAVILNEHLTKALRLLKRGSSNDAVDRQLLSNLIISFLTIPRQDSKRFEVLKIVANVLSWSGEQKEMAGLLRPGSSVSAGLAPPGSPQSTRSPMLSPSGAFPGGGRPGFFDRGSRRSSSAAGLNQLQAADFIGKDNASMSELWINFLEKSSEVEPVSRATSPGAMRTPAAESPTPAAVATP
ncbi:hypothetical protein BCR37DRAFT_386945 [Protomyces lactucae-debilis]|uniref:GRIP domain-containing protein n=1 Tax=Protomyces lactucae-debilis TaxID=2754530 RepID=A0A1Y2FGJ9_PROLT|nr:uncharacterized protein BCR37DRAFT_386945 [Protomyces lactucae-debilis]ORY83061.1 hypothetical protein BCR37DRAFT_386945 [Protomyces lactucae-debilis]